MKEKAVAPSGRAVGVEPDAILFDGDDEHCAGEQQGQVAGSRTLVMFDFVY
jgi:hypothetical protein